MTGIYNKISGISIIDNELRITNNKALHALFVIDINNFKRLNDNFGKAFGDQVIIEAANSMLLVNEIISLIN